MHDAEMKARADIAIFHASLINPAFWDPASMANVRNPWAEPIKYTPEHLEAKRKFDEKAGMMMLGRTLKMLCRDKG